MNYFMFQKFRIDMYQLSETDENAWACCTCARTRIRSACAKLPLHAAHQGRKHGVAHSVVAHPCLCRR
jgi:hypothetical protein